MSSTNRTGVRARDDVPPSRPVRHCFWKYPLLAAVMLLVVAVLAARVGSPNWPRTTIAATTTQDPGGAVLAFTQELDGSAASWSNAAEDGVGAPDQTFVLDPLRAAAPLLRLPTLDAALATYTAASPDQQRAWAQAYDQALGSITPQADDADSMEMTPSPDVSKVATLQGDFGPVPTLVNENVTLAEQGYLEQYLLGVDPGHSLHLADIWLYDHPAMLNAAVANGLTDDQWGMVKERGFAVGPWYLILPAVIHVDLPNGATGQGFVVDNLILAAFFLLAVPLMPGLRSLPRRLRLYRLIYRYPQPRELDEAEYAPRPEGYHGQPVVSGSMGGD